MQPPALILLALHKTSTNIYKLELLWEDRYGCNIYRDQKGRCKIEFRFMGGAGNGGKKQSLHMGLDWGIE